MKNSSAINPANRAVLVLLATTFVVAGCAGTSRTSEPEPTTETRIEIQEAVGFTITEEVDISSDVRLDYEEALRLLEQGRSAEGIARLETVIADAPQLSAPLIDLGIAKHRAGDLEAAELHLQQALTLAPEHPIAHNELGIIYRRTGRFDEARSSYQRALAVYPGYHFARRNLAVLCDLYLSDAGCALENYEAYMQTVPGDDEASMWIADLRMRMGQ